MPFTYSFFLYFLHLDYKILNNVAVLSAMKKFLMFKWE